MSQHLLTGTTEWTSKNECKDITIALFDPFLVLQLHTPEALAYVSIDPREKMQHAGTMVIPSKLAAEQLENALAAQELNHTLVYMPPSPIYRSDEPLSLRLYLNEDVPADTLSNCIENDKIETLFVTSSGHIAVSGVHSFFPPSYCNTPATDTSLTTATIAPGNYHLTVYPTTYTPQQYHTARIALLGEANLHLINRHDSLRFYGGSLIALGIILAIASLFMLGYPLGLVALACIAAGCATRHYAKQLNKRYGIDHMEGNINTMYEKDFPHFIAILKRTLS